MREIVRTNDAVLVSAISALLDGANIQYLVLDQNMSVLEGCIREDLDAKAARRLAAAEALCEPGAEIVYAWPAFSMYPYLPALTGAREVRVPLAEGDVHDLDAMAAEVTAATQLLLVCNPNNPTATHIPAAEIGAFCERIPAHVTVILDEAYVEFQAHDDPDASLDLLKDFPNLVVLRTFSKCYGLAGLRTTRIQQYRQ